MALPRPVRVVLKIVGLLVAAIVLYFAVTLVQVWLTSREYDPQPAQAIVVMGAAQYDGVPSPDLQARLDEALLLYHEGYAPLVGVTGSKEPGDQFTEAESGARYLESQKPSVPSADILEAGGNDSWTNLADLAPELRDRGVHSILVVTDPFHEARSMAIASDLGFTPHPTPTHTSPITGFASVPYFLKEAVGVGLGRIIGFQNLHALG
jgi:uncharacterized SAM-binding protein YcdF (DUF218 family)